MIELAGSVYRVSFDKEGEATLVFKIPKSHRPMAMKVADQTEKPLTIILKDYKY